MTDFSCQIGWGSSPSWELESDCKTRNYMYMRWHSNWTRDLALQTEGKLLSQLIYVLGRSKVGHSLLKFCKHALHSEPFASYSSGLTVALVRGRCWIEGATLLDTGRAIVQTAQLGIIFHAACNAWGNATIRSILMRPIATRSTLTRSTCHEINLSRDQLKFFLRLKDILHRHTFFMLFDPTPCDKKSRSEHQTLFPLFGEGLGTRLLQATNAQSLGTRLVLVLVPYVVLVVLLWAQREYLADLGQQNPHNIDQNDRDLDSTASQFQWTFSRQKLKKESLRMHSD